MRSPQLELFDGKLVGMDALLAKAKAAGKLDYDAPVEGLQLVDKYTLRIKLKYPYYDLARRPHGAPTRPRSRGR